MHDDDSARDDRLIRTWFDAALRRSPDERRRLLDAAHLPEHVRLEVLTLLRHHDRLEHPRSETAPGVASRWPDLPLRLDDCVLRRLVGVGGMGAVYEAEQDTPRRVVAVKLLRPDVVSDDARDRLRREAGILGRLAHPGIAQIHRVGIADRNGTEMPYLVMEFVEDAVPLVEHADRVGLDLEARIDLLIDVADAVAFGHVRGVIHRDIKPSNILVGGDGRPRLIDFGIARLLDPDASESATLTAAGIVPGTPAYMAPECFERGDAHVDTRVDVYALGVVSYELLCGARPHEVDRSAAGGVRHAGLLRNRHGAVAIPPSTRSAAVSGDLDAILLTALDPDPSRRYQSAAELAADLRRFRRREPITARPAGTVHLLRLFVRRHRAASVATAITLAVTLLASVTVATLSWREARAWREAAAADAERLLYAERLEEVTRFLVDEVFAQADPRLAPGPPRTIGEAVLDAADRLETIADARVRGSVRFRLAAIRNALGSHEAAAGMARDALDELEVAEGTAGRRPRHDDIERARARRVLGRCLSDLGRYDEAADVLRVAAADFAGLLGSDAIETAEARIARASIEAALGRPDSARRMADDALAAMRRSVGDADPRLVPFLWYEAQILRQAGDVAAAAERLEHALAIQRDDPEARDPDLATTLTNLGVVLVRLDRPEEARALIERAVELRRASLPPDHPSLVQSIATLGYHDLRTGHPESAATRFAEAGRLYAEALGAMHPFVARMLVAEASALAAKGRFPDAERALRRALAIHAAAPGPEPERRAAARSMLGEVLLEQGRLEEARRVLDRAAAEIAALQRAPPPLVNRHRERVERLEARLGR